MRAVGCQGTRFSLRSLAGVEAEIQIKNRNFTTVTRNFIHESHDAGMGVHGLSSFLREKRRNIAKQLVFNDGGAAITPVVIDGWS